MLALFCAIQQKSFCAASAVIVWQESHAKAFVSTWRCNSKTIASSAPPDVTTIVDGEFAPTACDRQKKWNSIKK
jgi:hypothetical protein